MSPSSRGGAEAIFLSLFDEADRETARIRLPGRTGDVFHAHVAGVGAGARYGLSRGGRIRSRARPAL